MADENKTSDSEAPKQHEAPMSSAQASPRATAVGRTRPRGLRIGLLLAGPLVVLVVAAYVYVNGGRHAETDNAYVKADTVVVSAEVAGKIAKILVRENAHVHSGDVLFEIDDYEYRVARDRAESQLEATRSFIQGLQASFRQGLEELELAHTNVAFAERQLAREQSLAERNLGSAEDLDIARHDLDIAAQQIPIIEQRLAQLSAQLGGQTHLGIEGHAAFRTVKSMLETAELELARTVVRAPIDGVASHVPIAGSYVARGAPVMSLVSTEHVWIEANFKETQLTHVDVGQPVVVSIDTYRDRDWHGRVESISQATGAESSVIPAQNASGNWVKVAQRIPVRIVLDDPSDELPLRAGMSAVIDIDTGFRRRVPTFLGFLQTSAR